jgi:serine/threonine-protein kinase
LARNDTLPSAAAAADPFAGTTYRAIRPIGQGGMGEVFEVEHVALGKRAVAKLLKAQFLDDAPMRERFRFEAQAQARLSHPNLVEVFDLGETAGGRPFFVMERLSGRTLALEIAERRSLPAAEAVEIVLQVLAGLGAVHAKGIVHRDVKPENVFVCDPPEHAEPAETRRRRVKVLDFGVAKARRSGEQIAAAPAHPTEEGMAMGTPRTMAPEQIAGGGIDARADVYATGVLLYALVAGRAPFVQRGGLELLRAHLHERPEPPSRWTRDPVPARLDAAVLRALSKRPADRFPSAAAFAEELRWILAALRSEPAAPRGGEGALDAPSPEAVTEGGTVRMPRLDAAGAEVLDAHRGAAERAPGLAPADAPRALGLPRGEVWILLALALGAAVLTGAAVLYVARLWGPP